VLPGCVSEVISKRMESGVIILRLVGSLKKDHASSSEMGSFCRTESVYIPECDAIETLESEACWVVDIERL